MKQATPHATQGLRATCALVLLASVPAVTADTLAWVPTADLELERSFVSKGSFELTELSIEVDGESQDLPEIEITISNSKTLTIVDTYDEVEDGRALRFTRSFEQLEREMELENVTQDQLREREGASDLEGESVVFVWDAEEEEYAAKADDGSDIDEDLLAQLQSNMDFSAFLPTDEVDVEDSWEVDTEAVLAIAWPGGDLGFYDSEAGEQGDAERERDAGMRDSLEGKGTVTFAEIREIDGVRCAVLQIELEYEASWEGTQATPVSELEASMSISRSLEGELQWNLEASRFHAALLEASGTNSSTVSGPVPGPGGEEVEFERVEEYAGEIEYEFRVTVRE